MSPRVRLRGVMRAAMLVSALLPCPSIAAAHPAVGVAVDSRGTIVYSDIAHVPRVDRHAPPDDCGPGRPHA
jgi:hypothetical protein